MTLFVFSVFFFAVSRKREPNKAPPTTIRFRQDLHAWLSREGKKNAAGVSGLVNEAVFFYMNALEKKGEMLYQSIAGFHGTTTEDAYPAVAPIEGGSH